MASNDVVERNSKKLSVFQKKENNYTVDFKSI